MEKLAAEIDWVESHIDSYGTVVAKQPNVWGEARLTKHRDEFERIMRAETGAFEFRLNSRVSQSDQAYAVTAVAISGALGEGASGSPASATTSATALIGTLDDAQKILKRTENRGAFAEDPFKSFTNNSINISPDDYVDQLKRYQNHLNAIRRENEGDDTSDSPGYSLNLVRIPVSVLPGKHTRKGYGAEITVTAEPYMSENLLANTYRDLVVNDLVDQLSLPVLRIAEAQQVIDLENAAKTAAFEKDKQAKLAKTDRDIAIVQVMVKDTETVRKSVDAVEGAKKPTREEVAKAVLQLQRLFDQNEKIFESDNKGEGWKILHTLNSSTKFRSDLRDIELEMQRVTNNDRLKPLLDKLAESTKEALRKEASAEIKNVDSTLPILTGGNKSLFLTEDVVSYLADLKDGETTASNKLNIRTWNRLQSTEPFDVDEPTPDQLEKAQKELTKQIYAKIADALTTVSDDLDKRISNIKKTQGKIQGSQPDNLAMYATVRSGSRSRRALHPLPPSQVISAFGKIEIDCIARTFLNSYQGRHVRWSGGGKGSPVLKQPADSEQRIHLLDVRQWIKSEIEAAYDLLAQPEHLPLWVQFIEAHPISGRDLATDLRGRHSGAVLAKRRAFLWALHKHHAGVPKIGSLRVRRPSPLQLVDHKGPIPLESRSASDVFEALATPTGRPAPIASAPGASANVIVGNSAAWYEPLPAATTTQITELNWEQICRTDLTVSELLAWTVAVESALLNQRLHADTRAAAQAKGCDCYEGGTQLKYYLPETANATGSPFFDDYTQAATSFMQYVKCRWPVQVFAIDPVTQEQNVAEVASRRREMQLALSLALTSQRMNVETFTRLARRLETDVETIRLNRTVHGFAHGNDTFGWRFSPRVQTPPAPTTLQAIGESVFGVTRDCDTNQLEIEPGMRECVAIVLMPSFVPYCDFDVRSRWYQLTNPKNTANSVRQTMQLSRAITSMRRCSDQARQCAHLYRDGEVDRLLKRVHQLDRQLPLQTMRAQIPYENTLGGFEMFNTGVTDLSPELIGWYGAPGIQVSKADASVNAACDPNILTAVDTKAFALSAENDAAKLSQLLLLRERANAAARLANCPCKGTTLFLVGDNFSVHDTRVVAGGLCLPDSRLISRDIIQVTVPETVSTVRINGEDYVDIHIATPYGVTSHLHVPVHKKPAETEATDAAKTAKTVAELTAKVAALELPTVQWGQAQVIVEFDYERGTNVDINSLKLYQPVQLAISKTPEQANQLNVVRQADLSLLALKGGAVSTEKSWVRYPKIIYFPAGDKAQLDPIATLASIRELVRLQIGTDGFNFQKNGGLQEIEFEIQGFVTLNSNPTPRGLSNKLTVLLRRPSIVRLPPVDSPISQQSRGFGRENRRGQYTPPQEVSRQLDVSQRWKSEPTSPVNSFRFAQPPQRNRQKYSQ